VRIGEDGLNGGSSAVSGVATLRLWLEEDEARVAVRLERRELGARGDARDTAGEKVGEKVGKSLDLKVIDGILREMNAIMHRATRWGDADQGSHALLRRCGELLFDLLLPIPIKVWLRAWGGSALRVALDPRLGRVPIELLHTGEAFLGLKFAVGRVDAQWEDSGPGVWATAAAPMRRDVRSSATGRALVVCDPRGDLIGAYHEGLVVRDELSGLGFVTDLRSTEVTTVDLLRMLRDYEVVHFAGHGERPADEPGGRAQGWWLKDDVLTPDGLRELSGGRPLPRVVMSNACRSARADGGDGSGESLAQAMLELGTEVFIGTTHDVPDEVAGLFAFEFYAAIADQACVGEAVRRARVALAKRYGPTTVYGCAWVLHGEPEAELVRPGGVELMPAEAQAVHPGIHHVGARVRGVAAAPALVMEIGPIGATRGQAMLAALGAIALVALVVSLVLSAAGRPEELAPMPTREVTVLPWASGDGAAVLRAHPVEYQPVSPLPAE